MGEKYGQTEYGCGQRVLVEFVSANPVGPLNIVNARAAAVGDTLVRLLNASGYRASSEFYVNDAGLQVSILAESVYARYMELKAKITLPGGWISRCVCARCGAACHGGA